MSSGRPQDDARPKGARVALSAAAKEHTILNKTRPATALASGREQNAMSLSPAGTRWARLGLLAVTFVMGASLLLTSWSSYRGVAAASAALSRSQGEALIHSVMLLLRPDASAPVEPALSTFLQEQAAEGLRYVGVFDAQGHEVAAAGAPLTGHPLDPVGDRVGRPRAMVDLGQRMRMIAGPPPPPPDRSDPRGGDEARRRQRPTVAIEFEPLLARQLSGEAARAFSFGAVAAAALMAVALLLSRQLAQREAAERRLADQRRLAVLGEMSSVIAHELRNPLASLKGHAQLLAERLGEGSRERRKAERIVLEAERLEALSGDLLDFSRSGPIDRSPADPAALLRSAAESVDRSRVVLAVDGAPRHWLLDAERMRQVLTNLLLNAIQASPAGASVEASATGEGEALVFSVRDHGPGIPVTDQSRIFEPFYTTRTNGTGLGLAVAQRIVQMHGGTITAATDPGGGAVFRIAIPRG